MGYPGFSVSGIDWGSPLATIVQVRDFLPKSLGTLRTNTPLPAGLEVRRLPLVRIAGLDPVVGTDGMSKDCFEFLLK